MHHLCLLTLLLVGATFAQAQGLTTNEDKRDELSRQEALQLPATNRLESWWSAGKEALLRHQADVGIDVSLLAQRAAPAGKQTSFQMMYHPYASWQVLENTSWGSSTFNINYTLVHYWGVQSTVLQERTYLAVPINNAEDNQKNLQLSYTHTLPGNWDFLSATVGQYTLEDFDSSQYMGDQQRTLIHYALSKNASMAYPDSSFGAYLQANMGPFVVAGGYQDATNITGQQIRLQDAFSGKYTTFGAIIWTPSSTLKNGQYSFLYYHQPSVEKRPGQTNGWSLNAQQNIGEHWALFARVNGASGHAMPVKTSYALGGALLDPLARNENDAIIVGVAYNRLSRRGLEEPDFMHVGESVLEAQWVWGIGKLLTLTPDVQFIPRAGLDKGTHPVTVWGIRTTLML